MTYEELKDAAERLIAQFGDTLDFVAMTKEAYKGMNMKAVMMDNPELAYAMKELAEKCKEARKS